MIGEPVFTHRGEYDENWPLPEYLTLAQYSHVVFRPDAHFIDGQIIPRNLGDRIHGTVVGALIGSLHPACKTHGLTACTSLRLQISPSRIRVCDFTVLEPNAPHEQVPTIPPLLCIEVLAPEQSPEEELDTLADYHAMAVPNIWLIDPIRRAAFTFNASGLHEADPTHLTIPNTPMRLDLTEAFAAID